MMQTGRPRRHGVSMTEVMVAVGLAGFILTTTTTVLHRVMRQEQVQRAAMGCQVSVTRLAITFRRDVHRAHACWLAPADNSGDRLVLDAPDGSRVEYTVNGASVERRVSHSAEVLHRDQFDVGRDCLVRWEVGPAPERAALIVGHQHVPQPKALAGESPGQAATGQPHTIRVEAVVGRDYRFMQRPEGAHDEP